MHTIANHEPLLATPSFSGTSMDRIGVHVPEPRRRQPTPEQRLLAAVLEDAIRVWRRCGYRADRRSARLRAELLDWFLSEAVDWPCSFVDVCDHLGIDRAALLASLGIVATRHAA